MSSDQIFTVVLSGIGVIVIIVSAIIGLIIRITRKWTQIEVGTLALAEDFREYVASASEVHREIVATMKDDRSATNQRLTWLERNLYRTLTRTDNGPGM